MLFHLTIRVECAIITLPFMETGEIPVRARRREVQTKSLSLPKAAFGDDAIGVIREGG